MNDPRIKITMVNINELNIGQAYTIVHYYIAAHNHEENRNVKDAMLFVQFGVNYRIWGDETHVRIKQTS